MMTEVVVPESVFTARDRCDACGAQALVLVSFTGNRELKFCAHHYHELEGKFTTATGIVDESPR